jgi:hypothetical protein
VYWILFVMAAMAAIVIALILGGLATPLTHVVARAMVAPAAPEAAWAAIRDIMEHGSTSFNVSAEDAPRRLVAIRLDDNLEAAGTWTWLLEPEGAGTRITLTQQGSVENPIARFIAIYAGYTRYIDRHLHELAAQLGAVSITIHDATPTSA